MCDLFFFFKQKTAYERRISDWSSDVCSSDLSAGAEGSAVHHHTIIGGSRTMVNTSTARRVIFKHRSIPTWSVAARKSADPGHGATELPVNPDLTFANSAEGGGGGDGIHEPCIATMGPEITNGTQQPFKWM